MTITAKPPCRYMQDYAHVCGSEPQVDKFYTFLKTGDTHKTNKKNIESLYMFMNSPNTIVVVVIAVSERVQFYVLLRMHKAGQLLLCALFLYV